MNTDIQSKSIQKNELDCLIEQEVEMGFFEKYLDSEGNMQVTRTDGCTRISYCSCDCNHYTCPVVVFN